MEVNIYICLIFYHLIQSTHGLQCSQCKNVTLDSTSVSSIQRSVLSTLEKTFSTGQCTGGQSADLETCSDETVSGKITRCGQLVGNLRISIESALIDKFEFVVNIHITSCFTIDNTLTSGCSSDANILQQQQHVLSQVFREASSFQVGRFNGELCVHAIQSNRDGSGEQIINKTPSSNYLSWWAAIFVMLQMCLFC